MEQAGVLQVRISLRNHQGITRIRDVYHREEVGRLRRVGQGGKPRMLPMLVLDERIAFLFKQQRGAMLPNILSPAMIEEPVIRQKEGERKLKRPIPY
jgi:hypothetical protein